MRTRWILENCRKSVKKNKPDRKKREVQDPRGLPTRRDIYEGKMQESDEQNGEGYYS